MGILNQQENQGIGRAVGVTGDIQKRLREEATFWEEYVQICKKHERLRLLPQAEDALKHAGKKLSMYAVRQKEKVTNKQCFAA